MFYYWSNVSTHHEFLKHLWISFGCPGHGKGPWDGYGAVIKSYVRNTNTKGTTRITTPRGAAVAIERHFCSPDYEAKHANAKIQKVVVTFIEASEILRDVRAPSYDRLVGQQSAFSCAPPPSPCFIHPTPSVHPPARYTHRLALPVRPLRPPASSAHTSFGAHPNLPPCVQVPAAAAWRRALPLREPLVRRLLPRAGAR